ncbi:SseB family protein [Demequina sp. SYSU T00039]|uniref:SseB family protein n=1 Tax=Demequina lignilytica TaxID=3051663 RepID=A0AAW7M7V8_9MICO|nr:MULTISPECIES: SseB family protein [unclassified Demequina]MDN4477087.1 SseB family protein [Demequina sp. SYSU T00039-1]MDN4487260.1 SseB family protein [Demequina sp. SYSU T00039]MDN4491511.1 SseB family protein [Demequina sp. SYSU T00068]
MSESEPRKEIPESIFADDDGSADARLAQALIRHSRGKAPLTDVVDALAYARVLIPVMASGEKRIVGAHGLKQDAVASTGVVAVEMADGRTALPVFTDVDAMKAWSERARPIPAEGPRAALAAINEEWSTLVVNPGMETVLIPRPAVWALGQGEPWRPAVRDGMVADDVRDAVAEAVPVDDALVAVEAVAGRSAEVAVVLRLVPGLTQPEVDSVVRRVQHQLAQSPVVAQRVDSLELRLATA